MFAMIGSVYCRGLVTVVINRSLRTDPRVASQMSTITHAYLFRLPIDSNFNRSEADDIWVDLLRPEQNMCRHEGFHCCRSRCIPIMFVCDNNVGWYWWLTRLYIKIKTASNQMCSNGHFDNCRILLGGTLKMIKPQLLSRMSVWF